MRKIAIFVSNLAPGGAQRVCVNLANYISQKNNVNVYLIILEAGGTYESLVEDRVNKVVLGRFSLWSLYILLKKIQFDIIMSTLDSANVRLLLIKNLLRTKTIFITRAFNICIPWWTIKSLKGKFMRLLSAYSYRLSDFSISNSFDTEDSMVKEYKVPRDKIITIGNPVFTRCNYSEKKTIPRQINKRYIIAVGRLCTQKRYDLMLLAFKIISDQTDVDLYIFGEGPEEQNIKKTLKTLNLEDRVHMMGILNDLDCYYEHAECFLHCAEYEGFGNVIVEAISHGIIPVCFNCPGGPNFILANGEYGTLVPFGDVELFAQKVIDVINKTIYFEKTRLRERANYFSIEKKGDEYYNLFKRIYEEKYNENF